MRLCLSRETVLKASRSALTSSANASARERLAALPCLLLDHVDEEVELLLEELKTLLSLLIDADLACDDFGLRLALIELPKTEVEGAGLGEEGDGSVEAES